MIATLISYIIVLAIADDKISQQYQGQYTCTVTCSAHPYRVRARIQEVEEGETTQERFFQPHFLQAPGDMVAHEGRVCRLDCKVCDIYHGL